MGAYEGQNLTRTVAGHQHNPNARTRVANSTGQLQTVHHWHHDIDEDGINPVGIALHEPQRLASPEAVSVS
jgi:hypothetical protein